MRAQLLRIILAAMAVAAGGCGGGGSSPDPDAFVGTWTYQSGSIMPNCSGITLGTIDLTGDAVMISKVDSSHVAMTVTGTGVSCDVRFTVGDSKVANVEPNQTCSIMDSGQTATVNVTSWSLSLSSSGIDMLMTGTASVSIISCAPMATGHMERGSSDAAQGG